jgi:glycerophosphoryl diester phosphodiesterase
MSHHLISIFTGLILVTACTAIRPMKSAQLPAFDTQAHRGGRGLMPENTIPAMIKAVDLGVSTLEMDVHITADNKVVLMHDDHINPLFTLSPEGKSLSDDEAKKYIVYKMAYPDLLQFDVGSKFYPAFPKQQKLKANIPLLANLIDSVQNYLKVTGKPQVFYNIETKSTSKGDNLFHPKPEEFVKLLMDVIEQKRIQPWTIVQSFDPRTLKVLHAKYPKIRTSFLTSENSLTDNLKRLDYLPDIYSPNSKLVTDSLVKECHERGMKIIPWTINKKEEIERLKIMGVDGIITDYPNLFLA